MSNPKYKKSFRTGSALLVVLFIVMAITILSLGFLSKSDVELACGRNMVTRTQMDYLAQSGLEHARGLLLNPQEISDNWTGCTAQQLDAGSDDFYDIAIECDANDYCNYIIDCNAYRIKNSQQMGFYGLTARLRFDPCIGLWCGRNTYFWPGITINSDVVCDGTLLNNGVVDGDVYTDYYNSTSGGRTGQLYSVNELSLSWPVLNISDFTANYDVETLYGSSIFNQTFGPYEPVRLFRYTGDMELAGDVEINGMLIVNGDLIIEGTRNSIIAAQNLPALYVTGDLIIQKNAELDIEGLAVINGDSFINGDAKLKVLGGLFIDNSIYDTTEDSSELSAVLYNGTARSSSGKYGNALTFDGSNDYAKVTTETDFDIAGSITVSAWIKVSTFNRSYQAIVTKGDSAWRIQRYSSTNCIEFACTGLSHNSYGNIYSNRSVNDGQWHHIAGIYDGSKIYLYIDGVLDKSISSSGSINRNNYNVIIGENEQNTGRYWNGLIDDVQIYDRALDANEVILIKSGGTTSGLVGHWQFDEDNPVVTVNPAPVKTAIVLWDSGSPERWSQAAGAFYKRIEEKD